MAAAPGAALRADAAAIARAAIAAADPAAAVVRALADTPDLTADAPLHIIAIGKAAATMADAALGCIHAASADIVVPHGTDVHVFDHARGVRVIQAGHPLPDLSSLAAGNAIDEILSGIPPDDIALILLSGGASALAVLPDREITFIEYAHCIDLLMRAGADIRELNTVRHHLDTLKGGGMARRAAPARIVGLILSDVIGDHLDIIASGPLTPALDTPADAVSVLMRRGIWDQCAPSIRETLTAPPHHTPTIGASRVCTRIVANNRTAVEGAAAEAARLGYSVRIHEEPVTGEAREAGAQLGRLARQHAGSAQPLCIVAGGETSVTVRGSGTGGRNQELALAAALELEPGSSVAVASLGTDGIDGPTDAAGAICDATTVAMSGREAALAALQRNDSYTFLDAAGALLRTGPTGTNVADIQLILIG